MLKKEGTKDDVEINDAHSEIVKFINDFNFYEDGNALYLTFTEGYCYDFAHIIWRNFKGVRIFFIKNGDHYVAEYNGIYYDISGVLNLADNAILIEDDIGISDGTGRLKKNKYNLEDIE